MKATVAAPLAAGDWTNLERALEQTAALGAPEYTAWRELALSGVAPAAHGDLEGVRRSCKGCHDQYRADYRLHHRTRPIP
jgi:hypothetical protein